MLKKIALLIFIFTFFQCKIELKDNPDKKRKKFILRYKKHTTSYILNNHPNLKKDLEKYFKHDNDFIKKLSSASNIQEVNKFLDFNKSKNPYLHLYKFQKPGEDANYFFGTMHSTNSFNAPSIIKDLVNNSKNIFFEVNPFDNKYFLNLNLLKNGYNESKNTHIKNLIQNILDIYKRNEVNKHSPIYISPVYILQYLLLNFDKSNFKCVDNEIFKLINKENYNKILSLDNLPSISNYLIDTNKNTIKDDLKKDKELVKIKGIDIKINKLQEIQIQALIKKLTKLIPANYSILNQKGRENYINNDATMKNFKNLFEIMMTIYKTGSSKYLLKFNSLNKMVEKNKKHWIHLFFKGPNENIGKDNNSLLRFYYTLFYSRNNYWLKKIKNYSGSFIIAGDGHFGDDPYSLRNLLKQKGYKITHVLGNDTLEKYKKKINNSNDETTIKSLCQEAIDIIPYNYYYCALIYKLTAEKLKTLKNKSDLKIINEVYNKSIDSLNKAITKGNKVDYTKEDCVKIKSQIQNKLNL